MEHVVCIGLNLSYACSGLSRSKLGPRYFDLKQLKRTNLPMGKRTQIFGQLHLGKTLSRHALLVL